MRLQQKRLQLERRPGPLRPQILAALREHGSPLRWAITAVRAPEPGPGSVSGPGSEPAAMVCLQIEAVVLV